MLTSCRKSNFFFMIAIGTVFVLGLMRVHLRVQTTLIGYEVGRLKTREAQLLEERNRLQVDIAKLTTRKHLQLVADSKEEKTTMGAVAKL